MAPVRGCGRPAELLDRRLGGHGQIDSLRAVTSLVSHGFDDRRAVRAWTTSRVARVVRDEYELAGKRVSFPGANSSDGLTARGTAVLSSHSLTT